MFVASMMETIKSKLDDKTKVPKRKVRTLDFFITKSKLAKCDSVAEIERRLVYTLSLIHI